MPNIHAVFITNSPQELRGSSLYVVFPNGTVRLSGANDGERKATMFIRPYLVGYCCYYKSGLIFSSPQQGLFPVEAAAKDYRELGQFIKEGEAHKGNCITEIIAFHNLFDPSFAPNTWNGIARGGIAWNIAIAEVSKAISEVHRSRAFTKSDTLLELISEEKLRSPRMFG